MRPMEKFMKNLVSNENNIEQKIFVIRNQRVMIDSDLAKLYGVKTKRLNEAVKRNIKRFPEDFMFQLTDEKQSELVANCDHLKNLKYSYQNAYAFTEHGVTMLASVLNSDRAIEINVQIVRTFIKLRQYAINKDLNKKEINELKQVLLLHIENSDNRFAKHDEAIRRIVSVLNNFIKQPKRARNKKIGFDLTKK